MRTAPWLAAAVATAALLLPVPAAHAGGSPETTVVVVNADSPSSLRLANDYARRRRIPAENLCYLEGVPTLWVVDVDTFRQRLWGPVKAFLEARGLLDSVDCVAWSADFPYGVDFKADKEVTGQPPVSAIASLTSMTYLWRKVEAKDGDGYTSMQANAYYRRDSREGGPAAAVTEEQQALRNDALGMVTERRYEEAAKAYAKLLETLRTDPVSFYNYACCLARLNRQEEAVKALADAVAAGFSDAEQALKDPDLEILKPRQDFQDLLARMARPGPSGASVQPARGFRARYAWGEGPDPDRAPPADAKERYLLSTMLAYTGTFGNSMPEALACLASAASSDGTNPDGTFYFLANDDVRANTREIRFDVTVEALRAMGRKAVVLTKGEDGQTGVLPVGKPDVLGAVIGAAGFNWAQSKSTIVPGAICEHLTSFGAMFNNGGQTKLTELLRHGAAGASGTVNEPWSIQAKFPVPHIQAHYAAGCSLAEAFYQSVWGPYQLLVVGDPLARPFAKFAKVAFEAPKGPVSGTVTLTPSVTPAQGTAVARTELWVDGRPVAEAKPGEALAWDASAADEGPHEVRVVAVEDSPLETRSFAVGVVTVGKGKPTATISGPRKFAVDDTVVLTGKLPGAKELVLLQGAREIVRQPMKGDAWKATFPASELGVGTVVLQARGERAKGPSVRSPFHEIAVEPGPALKPVKVADKSPGWRVEADGPSGAVHFVVEDLGGPGKEALGKTLAAKAKDARSFAFVGEFPVRTKGLYQLVISASGEVEVEVDGRKVLPARQAQPARQVYAQVHLEAGAHAARIRFVPAGSPDLTVLLAGDLVAQPFSAKR